MHSIALFCSGSRPTLKLGLALLVAGCAALPSASGQAPAGRQLQVTVSSGMGTAVTPVGWQFNLQAQVIDSAIPWGEPVAITLHAPGLLAQPAISFPLWNGGLVPAVGDGESATPGHYTVTATASFADLFDIYEGPNWLTDSWLAALAPVGGPMESTVSVQATVVGLTGVTDYRQHVAIGDTVNFSATMEPIDAFEWVWWDWAPMTFGVATGRQYSRTMNGWGRDPNGVVEVTAMCGNSVVTVPITVYQITGLSASSGLVAAGDTLTFTAAIDPLGASPPPIEWFVDGVWQGAATAGSTFATTALQPGHHTISAKLGTSEQYAGTTVVGINGIELEPPTTTDWIPWPTPAYVPVGDSFRVRAIRNPPGDEWPSGYPVWSGAASGVGSIGNASFPTASPSVADVFSVIAMCGNTVTKGAVVVSLTPNAVPVDNFEGRALDIFGISELVDLSVAISPPGLTATEIGDIYWETDTIDGRLSKGSSGSADGTDRLSGPPLPMSVVCGALYRPSTYRNSPPITLPPLTMAFIAPSDIVFHKLPRPSADPNAGLWHIPQKFSIGFRAEVEVMPSYVSWERVTMKEIDNQKAEVNGWFQLFTDEERMHRNDGAECSLLRGAAVGSTASVILDRPDWILLASVRVPNDVGSFTWKQIPWAWRGKRPDGTWESYDEGRSIRVDQTFTSDTQQTAGAKKKDAGFFYRAWNSPNALGVALPQSIQNRLPPGW